MLKNFTRSVLTFLVTTTVAWGASFDFTGPANSNWSTPGNWTITNGPAAGTVPGFGDDVTIGSTKSVLIDYLTDAQVQNLTVSGTLTLISSVDGPSELTVGGNVIISSGGNLTIGNGNFLSGGTLSLGKLTPNLTPTIAGPGTLTFGTAAAGVPNRIVCSTGAVLALTSNLIINVTQDAQITQADPSNGDPSTVPSNPSASIQISSGSNLNVQSGTLSLSNGVQIVNAGTLGLSRGASLSYIDPDSGVTLNTFSKFQNTGTLNWTIGSSIPAITSPGSILLNGSITLIRPTDYFPVFNEDITLVKTSQTTITYGSLTVIGAVDFTQTRGTSDYTFRYDLTPQLIDWTQTFGTVLVGSLDIDLTGRSNADIDLNVTNVAYSVALENGGPCTATIIPSSGSGIWAKLRVGTAERIHITATAARTGIYDIAEPITKLVVIGAPVAVSITTPGGGFSYGAVLSATSNPSSSITWSTTNSSVVAITNSGATATVVGVGTASVTATAAATGAFVVGSTTLALGTINKKNATVTVNNQTRNFGEVNPTNSFSVTGLISGDTTTSLGTPTYSGTGVSANLTTGAGDYPINVSFPTSNYTQTFGPQANLRINAALLTQNITFGSQAALTVGTTRTLPATSSAGLTITYISSNPAVAAISSGNILTGIAAGSADITATQVGNTTYAFAPSVTQTVTVIAKLAQTITYVINGGAPTSVEVGQGLTLTAASTSLLAITYTSSDPTIATMVGDRFTAVAPSSVTITASQSGDATYNAATSVARTITVIPAGTGGTTASASSSGASGGCGAGGGVALVLGMLALGWRRRS